MQQPLDIETLARLRATPEWRRIKREDEAAIEAEHARAAELVREAEETRNRELPQLDAKLQEAQKDVEKTRVAFQRAEAKQRAIVKERQNVVGRHRASVCQAEAALRSSAPAEIAETRSAIDRTMQAARGNFQLVDILPVPQLATDPKPGTVRSNTIPVNALMTACIVGIRRCDELTTAPMTRAEIREELARIRASIPRLESTTFGFELDVAGKQPMFERVTGR